MTTCLRGVMVMVWACALADSAWAQVAPSMALQRSKLIATEVDLHRMRELPGNELQRLETERRAACHSAPRSKACEDKSLALQVRRPQLLQRIEFIGKHAPLTKPAQPAAASGKCQGCHSSPGAAAAADPMRPPVQLPTTPSTPSTPSTPATPTKPSTPAAPTAPTAPPTPPGSAGAPFPPTLPGAGDPKVDPKALRCFIATAAYGSAHTSEVAALRRFRDQQLLPYAWGRVLVDGYYQVSPPLAQAIAARPLWRAAVRGALTPMVWGLEHAQIVLGGAVCALMLVWRRRLRRQRLPGGT